LASFHLYALASLLLSEAARMMKSLENLWQTIKTLALISVVTCAANMAFYVFFLWPGSSKLLYTPGLMTSSDKATIHTFAITTLVALNLALVIAAAVRWSNVDREAGRTADQRVAALALSLGYLSGLAAALAILIFVPGM
jgi:hypothetical protein